MENKKAVILVLAVAAALIIAASATYAMVGRPTPNDVSPYGRNTGGYGMGASMMGGSTGYAGGMMGGSSGHLGGMMGGYGMMVDYNATNMYQYMQHMWRCWNSTVAP